MTADYILKHTGLMYKADMILAYLDERKNQTRRTKGLSLVNEKPDDWELIFTPLDPGTRFVTFANRSKRDLVIHINMPYGGIGDQLYFKETWRAWEDPINGEDFIQYRADNEILSPLKFGWDAAKRDDWDYLVGKFSKWQSSMFMPLKVARIRNVPILNVRIERLQNITATDAENEGCPGELRLDPIQWYQGLWNEINGEILPWAKNPWVWVYEFPMYQKP